jgi:hypothetical protein
VLRSRRKSPIFCRLNYRKSRFLTYFRRYTLSTTHKGFFSKLRQQYMKLRYLRSKVRLFNLLPYHYRTKNNCKILFSRNQRRYLRFRFNLRGNKKKVLHLFIIVTQFQKNLYICFKKIIGTPDSRRRLFYYRHEKDRIRRFKKIRFFLHSSYYYKRQTTLLIPFLKIKFAELPYKEFQSTRFSRLLAVQRVAEPPITFPFLPHVLQKYPRQLKKKILFLPKNMNIQKNQLSSVLYSQFEILNPVKTFLQQAVIIWFASQFKKQKRYFYILETSLKR